MLLEIDKRKQFLLIRCKRNCNLISSNTEQFKDKILSNHPFGQPVILDLGNLDFIDSAGLSVLIHLRRKISASNGALKITNLCDRIQKLMQITRLHRVFEIYDSVESAIKSIQVKTQETGRTNPDHLHFQIKKSDSYTLVTIKQPDSLIKANTKQFRAKIGDYLENTKTLILNFDNIRNIDSAGIASLIHLKRLSREKKKKIFLVYNNRVLNKLFKLYSLDDLFYQFQNNREAIMAVEPVKRKTAVPPSTPKNIPEVQPVAAAPGIEFSDIVFLTAFKNQ